MIKKLVPERSEATPCQNYISQIILINKIDSSTIFPQSLRKENWYFSTSLKTTVARNADDSEIMGGYTLLLVSRKMAVRSIHASGHP